MSSLLIFALISLVISPVYPQCTLETAKPHFRRSIYEFSLELVKNIANETNNHFVTSALSAWSLLSTLSLGAGDRTLTELTQVLKLHAHQCFNNKYFEIIQGIASNNQGSTVLERSSVVFVDFEKILKKEFKDKLNATKASEVKELNLEDLTSAAASINNHVNEVTHGTINKIVEPMDLSGVYMILLDALYFKGPWQDPFSADITHVEKFKDEKGNEIGDVNMMVQDNSVNYTDIIQINTTIIELPYGKDKEYSMLFMLPKEGTTVTEVLHNIQRTNLETILSLLAPRRVLYQIPRFQIESNLNFLKSTLIKMGLSSIFSTEANFDNMSDYSVHVSNIIQKATIKVTENGTEASAATAGFFQMSMPTFFTLDRPFLFMLINRQIPITLFSGAYSKPSLF